MSNLGIHIIADFYEVSFVKLNALDFLRSVMLESVEKSGATYISHVEKQFSPHGITILVALAESHVSIHTYPENGIAMVDYFTCGDICLPKEGILFIKEKLESKRFVIEEIERGMK